VSAAVYVHCEVDDWDYDPRYTEGSCPICRQGPPGAPVAPRWLLLSRRVPWDFVFLGGLFLVALVLGMAAVQASGLAAASHLPRPHFALPTVHLPHR
jgi:hypothetical protein